LMMGWGNEKLLPPPSARAITLYLTTHQCITP
jgi:hypothetical protein